MFGCESFLLVGKIPVVKRLVIGLSLYGVVLAGAVPDA